MLDKTRRMFKIDMQKPRRADSSHLFWMDLLMLIIVAINLMYLFFGFLFHFGFFSTSTHYISSDFFIGIKPTQRHDYRSYGMLAW